MLIRFAISPTCCASGRCTSMAKSGGARRSRIRTRASGAALPIWRRCLAFWPINSGACRFAEIKRMKFVRALGEASVAPMAETDGHETIGATLVVAHDDD